MTERALQRDIIAFLRVALAPHGGLVATIPNAPPSKRRPFAGMRRGEPDMLIVIAGQAFPVELKTKSGVTSEAQLLRHDEYRRAGAPVAIWKSLSDAEEFVSSLSRKEAA